MKRPKRPAIPNGIAINRPRIGKRSQIPPTSKSPSA